MVPIHWFLTLKLCIVRKMKANYNHGQKLGNFWISGAFPIHTYPAPAPSLSPQTTWDACFQNFSLSLLLKDRALICRDAIKRSILAQYIIPYFKADISLFPKGDRLTQISLYISLLHHDWQSRVAKFKIKKNGRNVCCIYSHQLTQQLAHDKVQDRNIVYLPGVNWQDNRNKIRLKLWFKVD